MLDRRLFLAGTALLAAPAVSRAQGFPSRTITMVVPYPAGGPTDVIARIIAQAIEGPLGHKVIVENKAGASGSVGTRAVATADPDGHTIVFGNNQTHGNNMFMLKEPGYDAVKDFAPLAGVGAFQHLFVVKNGLPAQTIGELVDLAKKDPGKLNYGSTGIGSGSHLSMELFMTRTGIRMEHIPYRGAAPLVQDIIGGRIDASLSTLPSVLGQVQAGTMRALAIASPKRAEQLPNVPTLEESGVRGANAESWAAIFAPVRTPQPVLDRLSKEIVAALGQPAVREAILKIGFTLDPRDPAAFRPYLDQEIATWGEVIRQAGVKPE